MLATCAMAQAPTTGRVIGILEYGTRAVSASAHADFREGLRERGFVDGRHYRVEPRYADYDFRKLDRLASELASMKVDVIYAPSVWSTHAAKSATSTIPIVFSGVNDPVTVGFVKSLSRPAGNVTGISIASAELTAKRVELMRAMFPAGGRFGVVFDEEVAEACQIELKEIANAGRQLGVDMQAFQYVEKNDLREVFENSQRAGLSALLLPTSLEARRMREEFVGLASTNRTPMMYASGSAVEAGGLMSYGPDDAWPSRRAGNYVARILNGAKPGELPVERPTRYELVINLRTARALGVSVPQSILLRADRVIE